MDAVIARGPVPEKPALTEGSCNDVIRADWIDVLTSLWFAIGKPVDDRRLKIYTETFKRVPYGLLQASVSRALRETGNYNVVPAIGAIWEALKKELHNPREMERAIEEWCAMRFWSVVHRFEGED